MISIIIITLNEEQYVGNLLSDLAQQTQKPYEVIVVDGYSKDKTIEVINRYKKKLPLTILKEDPHPSLQRNRGAQAAIGTTLIFLDADIYIPNKNFLKSVSHLSKEYGAIFPNIKIKDPNMKEKGMKMLMDITLSFSRMIGLPGARGGCMIINRKIFKKVQGFNEFLTVAEDVEMRRRLSKHTKLCYPKLSIYEDHRRYRQQGILKTLWIWIIAGICSFFHKKPKEYKQIR